MGIKTRATAVIEISPESLETRCHISPIMGWKKCATLPPVKQRGSESGEFMLQTHPCWPADM